MEEKKPEEQIAAEAAVEVAAEPKTPVVRMQHVIITLADGRRGVFMGPELIRDIEMKLGSVPKLVSVDFDPPRAVAVPISREEVKDADTKADEKPASDVGEKA